jgi:phosphoserine aminotransferase
MLGCNPVDVCYWESFGKGWYTDINQHLKIENVRKFSAPYGQLPNLNDTSPEHDIVFTYNGTTSGVCVPHLDWIEDTRTGLTFNDATSAVFAMNIDWTKVDVTTYSWQKVLGGEGGHGMIILSPRAIERLETFEPNRPLPKIFRLTKQIDGKPKINYDIFEGSTINTPSMLCIEDYIDALNWAKQIGGMNNLITRSKQNLEVIEKFCVKHSWINFLAVDSSIRSNTSVCLTLELTKKQINSMIKLLEEEQVAYDINSYRDSPLGIRIWCGATIETYDLELLMNWIEWSYENVKSQNKLN